MQNPLRTLLYGLFVAPVLGALQDVLDWFGKVAAAVKSGFKTSHDHTRRTDTEKMALPRDTRSHWEKMGVIVPVYRLVSEGLSDRAIAVQLNLTENTVYGCIGYLVRRLKCRTRAELVLYASPKPGESWNLRTTPRMLISGMRRWRQRRLANAL